MAKYKFELGKEPGAERAEAKITPVDQFEAQAQNLQEKIESKNVEQMVDMADQERIDELTESPNPAETKVMKARAKAEKQAYNEKQALHALKLEQLAKDKTGNVTPGLDAEIQKQTLENARENLTEAADAFENNKSVWVRKADGKVVPGRVLDIGGGKVAVGYLEGGVLKSETRSAEEFTLDQREAEKTGVKEQREVFGPDILERGEQTLEKIREASPKIFDKVTKSGWLLTGRVGRLLTSSLGAVEKSGALAFANDLKEMVKGTPGAAAEITGGVPDAVKTIAKGFWGAPKEVLSVVNASMELNEIKETQVSYEGAKDMYLEGDVAAEATRDLYAHGEQAEPSIAMKVYHTAREAGAFVRDDIILPTIKGDIELVTMVQNRLESTIKNPAEAANDTIQRLMEAGKTIVAEARKGAEDVYMTLSGEKNNFDRIITEAENKLETVVTDRRLEVIIKRIEAMTNAKFAMEKKGQTSGDYAKTIALLDEKISELTGRGKEIIALKREWKKYAAAKKSLNELDEVAAEIEKKRVAA